MSRYLPPWVFSFCESIIMSAQNSYQIYATCYVLQKWMTVNLHMNTSSKSLLLMPQGLFESTYHSVHPSTLYVAIFQRDLLDDMSHITNWNKDGNEDNKTKQESQGHNYCIGDNVWLWERGWCRIGDFTHYYLFFVLPVKQVSTGFQLDDGVIGNYIVPAIPFSCIRWCKQLSWVTD